MPLPKQGAFLIQAMILAALALNVPSSQVFDPFFQMAAAFFICTLGHIEALASCCILDRSQILRESKVFAGKFDCPLTSIAA